MANTPVEKRKHPRKSLYIPLMCWEFVNGKRSEQVTQVVSKNLSESGVAFKSTVAYPIGTQLHAEIYLPNHSEPVITMLKVARIEAAMQKETYVIGATFVDLSPNEQGAIASCLKRLNLYQILEAAVQLNASDIHLTIGHRPIFRVRGKIQAMENSEPIQNQDIQAMMFPLLNDAKIKHLENHRNADFAFSPDIHSRFRVNLHYQKGFLEAAIRSIPRNTKSFEDLGLPVESMKKLCEASSGLILITGTTGSGKTTTLTAMVDHINQTMEKVIVTIEDPIEFVHSAQKSIVKQRELGSDTDSYSHALSNALRQDPDLIVVGELIDRESIATALKAAETGHIVISTIHAPDTTQAIERIINFFPPENAMAISQQVASCLVGILYQLLVPTNKNTLTLATELLINNPAIANTIRDRRLHQIKAYVQTGSNIGMYTLESSVQNLYNTGKITLQTKDSLCKPA